MDPETSICFLLSIDRLSNIMVTSMPLELDNVSSNPGFAIYELGQVNQLATQVSLYLKVSASKDCCKNQMC